MKPEFKVNGHRCSYISSPDRAGRYRLHFDRAWEENTIEALEAVDWTTITVKKARSDAMKCYLPGGYTFSLETISYLHTDRVYVVSVLADERCYGDVASYQAQIDELNALRAQKDAQIAEAEEKLTAATAQLAELEECYDGN